MLRLLYFASCALLIFTKAVHAQPHIISTLAGSSPPDGGMPALSALLRQPQATALDSTGKLYIGCRLSPSISQLLPNGQVATFAQLPSPSTAVYGLAVDAQNNLYASDGESRVYKISTAGAVALFAGGQRGAGGDGGPALAAQFVSPQGLAADRQGNLYIADFGNYRVRRVNPSGAIDTVAGASGAAFGGDGGPARQAGLYYPTAVAVAENGTLYIAEQLGHRIRAVAANGIITTFAGTGMHGFAGQENDPPTMVDLGGPVSVAVDALGRVFIATAYAPRVWMVENGRIRTIAGAPRTIPPVPGSSYRVGFSDNITASEAWLASPSGLSFHAGTGMLYFADRENNRIRAAGFGGFGSSSVIRTVAGGSHLLGDNRRADQATLYGPAYLAFDREGNLYLSDTLNYAIRRVSAAGAITTVAGSGITIRYDGTALVPAPSQRLGAPGPIAFDSQGRLYVADGRAILRMENGMLRSFAGYGRSATNGDGGPAMDASFGSIEALLFDNAGNLLIADREKGQIRQISTAGIASTVASAENITSLALDPDGVLYAGSVGSITRITRQGAKSLVTNQVCGRVAGLVWHDQALFATLDRCALVARVADGRVEYIAGNNQFGFSGDGGLATNAKIDQPMGIAVSTTGDLFFADYGNDRVRRLRKLTPAQLAVTGGSSQQGQAGQTLPLPLTVRVSGTGGIGVPGVTVTFRVVEGSASLNPPSAVTDSAGTARTTARLGQIAGPVVVQASVAGLAPVSFQITVEGAAGPVPRIDRILDFASLREPPVSGSWIAIVGANLSARTRGWETTDFAGRRMPASLEGVAVLWNGTRLPVAYVSPAQIKALAPMLSRDEAATIQVVNEAGASAPVRVGFDRRRPALHRFPSAGGKYLEATRQDGSPVGPEGLVGGDTKSMPAAPGEIITLHGSGFGPTEPLADLYEPATPLPLSETEEARPLNGIRIHNLPTMRPQFIGLAAPGEYQVTFRAPLLPDGEYPVQLLLDSTSNLPDQCGALLAVRDALDAASAMPIYSNLSEPDLTPDPGVSAPCGPLPRPWVPYNQSGGQAINDGLRADFVSRQGPVALRGLQIAASLLPGGNELELALMSNHETQSAEGTTNEPGEVLERFRFPGILGPAESGIPQLLSARSALKPLLQPNTRYWLVVISAPVTEAVWHFSTIEEGVVAFRVLGDPVEAR